MRAMGLDFREPRVLQHTSGFGALFAFMNENPTKFHQSTIGLAVFKGIVNGTKGQNHDIQGDLYLI